MKIRSTHTIAVITSCIAILSFAGCKGNKSEDVTARSGDPQSPAPAFHEPLSSYTFDKRDQFASQFTAMRAEFEAKYTELVAKSSKVSASEESRTAMAKLTEARSHFEKLFSALPTATAETWQTARDDLNRAWDRMQAAFNQAKEAVDKSSI